MADIYLSLDGQQAGPYQPAQIRQMVTEGKATAETPAWMEGMAEWSTVASVLAKFPPPVSAAPPPYIPPPVVPQRPAAPVKSEVSGCVWAAVICGAIAVLLLPCLAGVALGPITMGIKAAKANASMQQARAIGLAMFAYSADHNGAYPDGKTSTEVFQKLIDEKYISDPAIFYVALAGKTKAVSHTLTAENVCFDATSGVSTTSSQYVPVVFCTGYTVTYTAASSAVPNDTAAVPFPGPGTTYGGLSAAYKNNSAAFLRADPGGTVRNFISPNFDPGNTTYQQLKP